ncbi:MAG: SDR family oxidoreductase [Deltaproteobacteria bacterium]|nr:SDR family oxidoreductase [Deltaproteobacteria bacterium]
MSDFTGRNIVVTGAGTGIGRAIALQLSGAGAKVGLLGRRKALLDETAAEAKGETHVASVDVRDAEVQQQAFEEVAGHFGPLHALVANAGLGGANEPGPDDRWDEVVRTNLDYTAYCASKAALLGMARALALEWAPEGVLVNAICPGWVNTEMARASMQAIADGTGQSFEEARDGAVEMVPLQRMSEPQEIAELVAFLLGPGGASFTGQALDPNGGSWMG